METKTLETCEYCQGIGQVEVEYPEIPSQGEDDPGIPARIIRLECPDCKGFGKHIVGYHKGYLEQVAAKQEILDRIQEVKTKINKMQADINYIKAKVG